MLGRVPVARRMMTAQPTRLVVSLLGVGAAIGLVLLLQGLWNGQLEQITARTRWAPTSSLPNPEPRASLAIGRQCHWPP